MRYKVMVWGFLAFRSKSLSVMKRRPKMNIGSISRALCHCGIVCLIALLAATSLPAIDVWDQGSPNDDTPGNTRNVLLPGDSQRHDVEAKAGPTADQDWFRLVVTAGHSYEVRVGGRQEDCFDFGTGGNFAVLLSDSTTLVTTGVDTPGTGIISSFRATFVAPTSDTIFVHLTGSSTCDSSAEYTIEFFDTTLISPAWSTFGTFETFYSLHNAGSTTINGTLKLFNTSGVEVASVPVTIAPGLTFSTNTGALAVANNLNGAARFTHDGSPGSLIAEAAIANFTVTPSIIQPVKFQVVAQGN